jgi:transcriptional regulator GlxA family with amidase domain
MKTQYTFEDCPPMDILVVSGGWDACGEMNDVPMFDWLRNSASEVETLTSVSSG